MGQIFKRMPLGAPSPRYLSVFCEIWNFAAGALRVAIHANHEIAQRYLIAFRSYNVISSFTLPTAMVKVCFEDFQPLINADGGMIAQVPFRGGNVEPVGG